MLISSSVNRRSWVLPCIRLFCFQAEAKSISKCCSGGIKKTRRISWVYTLTGHGRKKRLRHFLWTEERNQVNICKGNLSHYPRNDCCQIFFCTCYISRFLAGALRKHFCKLCIPIRRHCSSDWHLGCIWQPQWFNRKWNTFLIVWSTLWSIYMMIWSGEE